MKYAPFLHLSFCAAVVISLAACSGNEQNSNNEGDSTDTTISSTTSTTETTDRSTTVTTPQNMMIARQRINDYSKWKTFYETRDSARKANGVHNYVIGRGWEDSNMLMVAMKVDDIAKAKAFAKDPSRRPAMQNAGVTGTPTFEFITLTFQDTARLTTAIRSMSQFKVKDWTAWQRSFDSGKQNRMQNGLIDRAYGHDADDSTKVVVVVAVADSAKARAYWNSNELKQRRARSGVIGEPKRFNYKVIQRY